MTFEKQVFTGAQVTRLFRSAEKNLATAARNKEAEVVFLFTYNAIVKIAIAACATRGLRVKSQRGHHVELLEKLADLLKDPDVELIGNEMRTKRNWDFYGEGIVISEKEAADYLRWAHAVLEKAKKIFSAS